MASEAHGHGDLIRSNTKSIGVAIEYPELLAVKKVWPRSMKGTNSPITPIIENVFFPDGVVSMLVRLTPKGTRFGDDLSLP